MILINEGLFTEMLKVDWP